MRNNITIFRGDDTAGPLGRSLTLTLKVPAGVDLAGCSASFEFAGIRRDFPGPLVDGSALAITYTAAETATMPLGAGFGVLRVWSAEGRVTTVRNTVGVVVTDNVYRAYPGGATNSVEVVISSIAWADVAGRPDLGQMVMPGEPTQRQLAAAVKTLWELLNGKVVYAALAALLSLSSLASLPSDIEWQDVPPTSTVASVVAEFAPEIDTSITNGLRGYADLSYNTNWTSSISNGREPWTVVDEGAGVDTLVLTNSDPFNLWRSASQTTTYDIFREYANTYAYTVWVFNGEEWEQSYIYSFQLDVDLNLVTVLSNEWFLATRELSGATTNVTHDALALTSQVDTNAIPRIADRNGNFSALQIGTDNYTNSQTVGIGSLLNGRLSSATGDWSHAEGVLGRAYGIYSHAEGYDATASGDATHAEGRSTIASGQYAHAEGERTQALGKNSHAEGTYTRTHAAYGHSEGYESVSSNSSAHAEGQSTLASGQYSHSEGYKSVASNSGAHAEGQITTASGSASHAEGANTQATGSNSHAEGNGTSAEGSGSHSEGYNTIASGINSHAEGSSTKATNSCAHAEGNQTTAYGMYSHAEGQLSSATGQWAHAEGYNTKAYGRRSHAEGNLTYANGEGAHAEGRQTYADGEYSHAEGFLAQALAAYSHAGGKHSYANGESSFAHGDSANAGGEASVAFGGYSSASNGYSFVWHRSNNSNNKYGSHGVGTFNIGTAGGLRGFYIGETNMADHLAAALGPYAKTNDVAAVSNMVASASAAIGRDADASGENAVAIGYGTVATNGYTLAIGQSAETGLHQSTAVGEQSRAFGDGGTALGSKAYSKGSRSLALGYRTVATGVVSVAIGAAANAVNEPGHGEGDYPDNAGWSATIASKHASIAIGYAAKSLANDAVQLGTGVNTNACSLQFMGNTLVGQDGQIPYDRIASHLAVTELNAALNSYACDTNSGVYYPIIVKDMAPAIDISRPMHRAELYAKYWRSLVDISDATCYVVRISPETYPSDMTYSVSVGTIVSGQVGMIDWGDGTSEEIRNISVAVRSHQYQAYGDYLIRIYGASISSNSLVNDVHHHAVTKVFKFGSGARYASAAFAYSSIAEFDDDFSWGGVTHAWAAFMGSTALSGKVPSFAGSSIVKADNIYHSCAVTTLGADFAWGNVTNVNNAFYNCKQLSIVDASLTDSTLMTNSVTLHSNVVMGANESVRSRFYTTWGGTKPDPE